MGAGGGEYHLGGLGRLMEHWTEGNGGQGMWVDIWGRAFQAEGTARDSVGAASCAGGGVGWGKVGRGFYPWEGLGI